MICHICGRETDFTCRDCDEPVCEDCCVVPTYHNQIDYSLCTDCGDANEAQQMAENEREWARAEKIKAVKDKRAAARRAAYWKPEAVEKRRVAKIERKRQQEEERKARMADAVRIVSEMFRGF